VNDSLLMMLRDLKLPGICEHAQRVAIEAERGGWSFVQYLQHLVEIEVNDRQRRRVARHMKASGLPTGKTLATLDHKRLPTPVQRKLKSLCEGTFIDTGHNVLAFGLPGRGKTHLLAAIGCELIQRGHKVLFTPAYKLVQRLLAAKEALRLEKDLKRLDHFDAVIIDDIGYIQQNRDEMEVLFTFLAERYERKSVLISSNLVFSQWDRIFKDPMTTAAAIDRLVHHSTILELTGPSFRTESAKEAHNSDEKNKKTTAKKAA
jgi:DNA replication protein DnaC